MSLDLLSPFVDSYWNRHPRPHISPKRTGIREYAHYTAFGYLLADFSNPNAVQFDKRWWLHVDTNGVTEFGPQIRIPGKKRRLTVYETEITHLAVSTVFSSTLQVNSRILLNQGPYRF